MEDEKVYIPESVFPISKKRLFRQYMRWLPAQLGLIDKTTFLFQIKKIYPDDIFLVSYPKSGNTWMRFVISYLIHGTEKTITFHDLENYVPDIYVSKDIIDSQKKGRIIKTHDIFFEGYPRVIYIHRDYRDALISYYHFVKSYNYFNGSFSEFIRSNIVLRHGSWKQHIRAMLKFKAEHPDTICVFSYENMLKDFEGNLKRLAGFCGVSSYNTAAIKEKTSFESMKKNENEHGSRFMNSTKQNFVRKGTSGGWKEHFTEEDLKFIYADKELVSLMEKLGYHV